MASAGARAYNWGLGLRPQRGPGAAKPPEAIKLFAFRRPLEAANLPLYSLYCRLSKSLQFFNPILTVGVWRTRSERGHY